MAESRLDVLIRLKDEITAGLRKVKKGFDDVDKSAEKIEDVDTTRTRAQLEALDKKINDVRTQTEKFNSQLATIQQAGLAIAGLGAALAAPFLIGVRATAEFSRQIAEVGTLVDDADQSTDQLRRTVLDLSNEFGADRADVARGLYQAISSGAAAGAEANEILRVALITARGGVTSVTAAVNGLSTVLNAFGLEARDAESVADALFVTVKNGRTTVDELSRFLFQAAPVASQLGISYQELNAALVTLTKQGVPTRVAFTQIRSAINGLVRDTPELTKAFEEYGGAQKVIAEQGLAKALQIARDAADGNVGVLNKLIGSIEGVGAVLGLTGPQLDEFRRQIEDQINASGDAAAAADEVADSFGEQLRVAIQRVGNAFEALGNLVVPILGPIVNKVGEFAEGLSNLIADNRAAQFFAGLVAVLGILLLGLGSLVVTLALVGRGAVFVRQSFALAGLNLQRFTTATGLATIATRGLTFAIRTLLGPVGLVLTAITLVIGATEALADETDDLTQANEDLAKSFDTLDEAGQQRALQTQRQLVRDLKREVRDLTAEQERLGSGGRRGGANSAANRLARELADAEARLVTATEQLEEFESKINEVNDATLDISDKGIKKYQEGIDDTQTAIDELIAEADELRAELEKPVTVTEPQQRTRASIQNAKRRREEEEATRDAAQERVNAISDEVAILRAAQGVQAARRDRAQELLDTINNQNDATEEQKRLLEENLALREKEADAADRALKLIQQRVRAEQRVSRALTRLQEQRDKQALEAGDIDQAEFEARARDRIQRQLEATSAGLQKIIEAERAKTAAQIAELQAEELADEEVDNSKAIADAQSRLAGVEAATQAALDEAGINATIAGEALGADLAQSIGDGFEDNADLIGSQLRTELQRLRAELDAGLITQQQFADGVAAANQKAADSYTVLRDAVAEALGNIADPEIRAALEALLRDIDIQVATLGQNISVFEQRLRSAVEGELAGFFEVVLTDIDDVNEAFTQLFANIGTQVKKLIAQKLAEKLTASLFGEGSVLGGLLGSGGGAVEAAGGGYIQAAKGGYVSRSMPQTQRTALFARAGGIVAGSAVRAAQRSTVALMARGGRYDDEDEIRRRRAARWGGVIRAASGGSIAANPINWTRDDHRVFEGDTFDDHRVRSVHSGSVRSSVRDDHSRGGQRVIYKAARGGGILKLTEGGGRVRGPGTKTSDSVPAMLSNGEYVVKAASVDRYGLQFLEALNRGMLSRTDTKQVAPRRKLSVTKPRRQAFADGGLVLSGPTTGGAAQGGANVGVQNAAQSGANTMKLEVNEAALNLTMRDFLEREFASILATR